MRRFVTKILQNGNLIFTPIITFKNVISACNNCPKKTSQIHRVQSHYHVNGLFSHKLKMQITEKPGNLFSITAQAAKF